MYDKRVVKGANTTYVGKMELMKNVLQQRDVKYEVFIAANLSIQNTATREFLSTGVMQTPSESMNTPIETSCIVTWIRTRVSDASV